MYKPLKCAKCGCLLATNEGVKLDTGAWLCDACADKMENYNDKTSENS